MCTVPPPSPPLESGLSVTQGETTELSEKLTYYCDTTPVDGQPYYNALSTDINVDTYKLECLWGNVWETPAWPKCIPSMSDIFFCAKKSQHITLSICVSVHPS